MNQAGVGILAGVAFAKNENGDVGAGDVSRHEVELHHGGAMPSNETSRCRVGAKRGRFELVQIRDKSAPKLPVGFAVERGEILRVKVQVSFQKGTRAALGSRLLSGLNCYT